MGDLEATDTSTDFVEDDHRDVGRGPTYQGKFARDAATLSGHSNTYTFAFGRATLTFLCIIGALASCSNALQMCLVDAHHHTKNGALNGALWQLQLGRTLLSYIHEGGVTFARGKGSDGFLAATYTGNASSQMTVDSDKFEKAQSFAELMARVYIHRWNATFDRKMMGKRRYPGGKLPRQQTRVSRTFFGGVRTFGCLRDVRYANNVIC